MTLAQLGADVIRFDLIGGGPDYRRWPITKDGHSLFWDGLNKGKRSIAIDFRTREGRELICELICAPGDDAGIFLTNFAENDWLNYDQLKQRRSDLIYALVMGDHKGKSAVDHTVNCRVGFPYVTGTDDTPTNHMLPAWDLITGQTIANGILAAERFRHRHGGGQLIRLALMDVALATLGNLGYIAETMINGVDRDRCGNYVFGAFGRDFETADRRRVMVVAITAKQWRALCKATGLSQSIQSLGQSLGLNFDEEGDRYRAREQLADLMAPWFLSRSFGDIKAHLDAAGACWGKYQTVSSAIVNDPDCSTENPLFQLVEQANVGAHLVPGSPLSFSEFPRKYVGTAPPLGANTDEVLAECLGLNADAIGRLHDKKIVAGVTG